MAIERLLHIFSSLLNHHFYLLLLVFHQSFWFLFSLLCWLLHLLMIWITTQFSWFFLWQWKLTSSGSFSKKNTTQQNIHNDFSSFIPMLLCDGLWMLKLMVVCTVMTIEMDRMSPKSWKTKSRRRKKMSNIRFFYLTISTSKMKIPKLSSSSLSKLIF